jgi:hypothetical protein
MARHARNLDLRERRYTPRPEHKSEDAEGATKKKEPEGEYKYPDRNLWERLRQDKDPSVRAALYENPAEFHHVMPMETLSGLPHICRLAHMRNPGWGGCFSSYSTHYLLPIFDPSDQSLKVTDSEREELAMAFLSNPAAIASSRDHSCPLSDFWEPRAECEKTRKRFWELLSAFPSDEVRARGYRSFGGEDSWKAEAYRKTDNSWLRLDLLRGATGIEIELLRLGVRDEDENCREVAAGKFIDPKKVKPGEPGMPDTAHWKYAWAAVTCAVPLGVAWLAFGMARTPFDGLVLALLGLLYLGMQTMGLAREEEREKSWTTLDTELRRLRELVGEQLSEDAQLDQRWQYLALNARLKQNRTARWIHLYGHTLTWAYVIYQLYMALRHGQMP